GYLTPLGPGEPVATADDPVPGVPEASGKVPQRLPRERVLDAMPRHVAEGDEVLILRRARPVGAEPAEAAGVALLDARLGEHHHVKTNDDRHCSPRKGRCLLDGRIKYERASPPTLSPSPGRRSGKRRE